MKRSVRFQVSAPSKAVQDELKRIADERGMSVSALLLVSAAYQNPDSKLKDLLLGR